MANHILIGEVQGSTSVGYEEQGVDMHSSSIGILANQSNLATFYAQAITVHCINCACCTSHAIYCNTVTKDPCDYNTTNDIV